MEIIVRLKFDIDEDQVKPRLGNRHGGDVEVALRECVAEAVTKLFCQSPYINLTHTNAQKEE